MSLWPYMNYNLQGSFYTMKDKLYQYSVTTSKKFFDKAQKVREGIKTPEELLAYQKKQSIRCWIRLMRSFLPNYLTSPQLTRV